MHLGRVLGNVTATNKYEDLKGNKFMIIEPLEHTLKRSGASLVAVDCARAGVGDIIYFVTGREASLALDEPFVPVDAAIVGIVDDVCS
ncbi:EutN/CcmL family microcompartment protein [bacterium]|nr:EutN/CcmL family microcompartment protein [bacterium]